MKKQLLFYILASVCMYGAMTASQMSDSDLENLFGIRDISHKDLINEQLIDAAKEGDTDRAKQLLEQGADVNLADYTGKTPLYWAAIKGYDTTVAELLKADADVNTADKLGRTPLYMATWKGHEKVIAQLLAAGANVDLNQDPYAQLPDDKKDMLNKLITEHKANLVREMMREVAPEK
ncbi:MAG: ankyrin repeat domain-containing protein [Candidatus Dependentiae bacterium]|nr:ankyrin repeat domain-containing protein [Candidatus Dependentiae bacterium]